LCEGGLESFNDFPADNFGIGTILLALKAFNDENVVH
jgi:hypothetical protein